MTRIYLVLLAITIACAACTRPQEPIFKRLEDIKVTQISTREVTINGEAIYHNPNGIGLTLKATDIDVIVDGVPVAKVQQDLSVEVPAKAEFSVPLIFNATPKDLFQSNKGGLIGGAINALTNKKIPVQYKGNITVQIAGITHTTLIDRTEEVKLK